MKYPLAEKFKAPQGEGLFAGTQMAFLRTVGCSVGKSVCTACDTDFDSMHEALGGGLFTALELALWVAPCRHVCLTGGEPLDRDLRELLFELQDGEVLAHIETSGTKHPHWLGERVPGPLGHHHVLTGDPAQWTPLPLWVTVSPKPGFREDVVADADEVKVILGGLGDGPGWPALEDALRWAEAGKLVYVQPRNGVLLIDGKAMDEAVKVVEQYPQLRLSVQLHKYLRTR